MKVVRDQEHKVICVLIRLLSFLIQDRKAISNQAILEDTEDRGDGKLSRINRLERFYGVWVRHSWL